MHRRSRRGVKRWIGRARDMHVNRLNFKCIVIYVSSIGCKWVVLPHFCPREVIGRRCVRAPQLFHVKACGMLTRQQGRLSNGRPRSKFSNITTKTNRSRVRTDPPSHERAPTAICTLSSSTWTRILTWPAASSPEWPLLPPTRVPASPLSPTQSGPLVLPHRHARPDYRRHRQRVAHRHHFAH